MTFGGVSVENRIRLYRVLLLTVACFSHLIPSYNAQFVWNTPFNFAPQQPSLSPIQSLWTKFDLTYALDNYPSDLSLGQVRQIFRQAFDEWSRVSPLTFRELPIGQYVDITIKFVIINEVEKKNTLAFAAFPPRGLLRFGRHTKWSTFRVVPYQTDLLAVAIHEIGHVLGLEHNPDPNTVMYFENGVDHHTLTENDILSIQRAYGPRNPGK